MQHKLLYRGFDQFDVAFQGALPTEAIAILKLARDKARTAQAPTLVTIGPGNVEMHVAEHGMRGGYAFVCDTGPTGEKWWFKEGARPSDWNIFASVHSKALVCASLEATFRRLQDTMARIGCTVTGESVNRVDFAMDFLAPEFVLNHQNFVTHRRAKVRPHWSSGSSDDYFPAAVIAGRRCESVTIGKMPGRQLIVYDKRRDTLDKRKAYWFAVWGIDATDPSNVVWRIELRAGKQHLKQRWGISRFSDLTAGIGDVFAHAIADVRYLGDEQTDSNVTRQELHPMWRSAREGLRDGLAEHRAGLTPDQVRDIDRQQAIDTYFQQIVGNAAGLSVALGLDDAAAGAGLPRMVGDHLARRLLDPSDSIWKGRRRAEDRLRFVRAAR